MSDCSIYHNATSNTLIQPPSQSNNITACAVQIRGNQTTTLENCARNSTLTTYENGCFAYTDLTVPQDTFKDCMKLQDSSVGYMCVTDEKLPKTTTTSATPSATGSPQPSQSTSMAANVGITKGAALLGLVLGISALAGISI